jgi:hypothetical protein
MNMAVQMMNNIVGRMLMLQREMGELARAAQFGGNKIKRPSGPTNFYRLLFKQIADPVCQKNVGINTAGLFNINSRNMPGTMLQREMGAPAQAAPLQTNHGGNKLTRHSGPANFIPFRSDK